MGNTLFCEHCDIEKFKLSRACADQFLNDEEKDQNSEDRWRLRLKCLDDAHSKRFGLTEENLYELIASVQKRLRSLDAQEYCKTSDLVIECLEKHPTCVLKCSKEMRDFIECVDTIRIKKLKEKIQEATQNKKTKV